MTSYRDGGFFNHGYHDSETLEIDRSKTQSTNPYAREDPGWWGERDVTSEASSDDASELASQVGWQNESWRGRETIPMDIISTHSSWQHESSDTSVDTSSSRNLDHSTFQVDPDSQYDRSPPVQRSPSLSGDTSVDTSSSRNLDHSTFQVDPDSQYDRPPPVPRLPSLSGNMTVRLRGMAMRRMSTLPDADPANASFTEEAIRNEMENEDQNLVKELVALSTTDRIQAIRNLPRSFEEKKYIRSQVNASKSSKKSRHITYIADCSEHVSLSLRRCGYGIRSARQTLELWHGVMKEIGGKFGTSVLSYFVFLKWLLMFNIFSFLVNFSFITIPMLIYRPTPIIPQGVTFSGLEILTGGGYFNFTVMYYGAYSNETPEDAVEYNIQLAYFFTIAVHMVLCGIALIYSMASSFRTNYVLADPASNSAWQLLCSWDFSVTNEKAMRQRRNNLCVQLKESLSEKKQRELLTVSEKLKHFGIHLGFWLLSTGLAVGCAASIYCLYKYEIQHVTQEAGTLLVPFAVSLMNLVIPLFYSFFNKFEHYASQRTQIYVLVVRNVLLRLFILAVLCYYWMGVEAESDACWETIVGTALYRLVIVDFLFLMLGSFFGEFLRNVIGTRFLPQLGVPEFDVARNVLDLIYAQTLVWIGIYFSPLLPAIQILKFFILFYVKKVSLTQNCQPPRRSSRAAQMQTIFIFLLFFPFFVGALSIVAYTTWRLTPSEGCGPFRGLKNVFSVVGDWISKIPDSHSAFWFYHNVIKSEIFYFLITVIILVIIYIFWQVIQGRKELIVLLRQRIVNDGKDKSFLLDKLWNLQKYQPAEQKKLIGHKKPPSDVSSGGQSNSNGMIQALLARQQLEEEEESRNTDGVPVPSDISTSSAVMLAMLARQRAERENQDLYHASEESSSYPSALSQATAARQSSEGQERDEYYSTGGMMQALHARQQLEEEEESHNTDGVPVPSDISTSSAVRLAMLARQRAERENQDLYEASEESSSYPSARSQAMAARQSSEDQERDEYNSAGGFHENRSSAFAQAMQARQRAEDSEGDMDDLPAPVSSVMMQVMQARKRAEEEEDGMPWVSAPPHNPASSGSSALIQAMLARQQAQNEYDDGY